MTAHPVSPILLDRSQAWQVIDAQRLGLAGLLDDLSEHEWQQPSLCDGWTVRDVAAHLTLQQLGARAAIAMMLRYRGDTDRAIRECACQRAAALSTGQITAAIRSMTGSRRHNFGVTYRETLIDILVHAQDIAIPLGRCHPIAPEAAAAAVTRIWTMRWPPPFPPDAPCSSSGSPPPTPPGPPATARRSRPRSARSSCCPPGALPPCRSSPVTAPPNSPPAFVAALVVHQVVKSQSIEFIGVAPYDSHHAESIVPGTVLPPKDAAAVYRYS